MLRSFYRIGIVSDDRTVRLDSLDGYRLMAMKLHQYIEEMTARHELDQVAVIFELSERGTPLVVRDFNWIKNPFYDSRGRVLKADICFEPKAVWAGLELVDLIEHKSAQNRCCETT